MEAGCPEGAAHGEFARARHRPREKKIGEIGAGYEKDKSGKANEQSKKSEGIFRERRAVKSHRVPDSAGVHFRKIFCQARAEIDDEAGGVCLRQPIMRATEQAKKCRSSIR